MNSEITLMGRVYFAFTLLLLAWQLNGQFRPDDKDWVSYDLTTGFWLDAPGNLEFQPRTNNHTFAFLGDWNISGPLHLGYGLGFSSENYHTNLRISTDPGTGGNIYNLIPDGTDYDYNKLNLKYIFLPIEFRLQTKANENGKFWRFIIGVRGGVRVGAYSEFQDDEQTIRYGKLEDFNRFRLGTFTRIGFDWFNIYGYYGVTPLFDSGQINGTPLNTAHALNFGISITP